LNKIIKWSISLLPITNKIKYRMGKIKNHKVIRMNNLKIKKGHLNFHLRINQNNDELVFNLFINNLISIFNYKIYNYFC